MSMHNPEGYQACNDFQRRDATEILQNFKDKMDWKKDASIIDLGCGDGSVTKIMLSQLPEDNKELLGVDISKEMVEHANKKYGDKKTKFRQMNIIEELPDDLKDRFDHAYSSFVVQFIPEQEKVFKNIYKLLKPGGTFLVIMLGSCPTFDIYYEMAKEDRWKECLKFITEVIPKFYEPENWLEDYKKTLETIGFKDCIVKDQSTTIVHDTQRFKDMVKSANIFHLDPLTVDEFFDVFIDRLVNRPERVDVLSENGESIKTYYSNVIVYGRK